MIPVCATHRPQEERRIKKTRPTKWKLTVRAGFSCVTYWEREYIDQLLSCCFLPHYQTTQITLFGQAAHEDQSELYNIPCSLCHVDGGLTLGYLYWCCPLFFFFFLTSIILFAWMEVCVYGRVLVSKVMQSHLTQKERRKKSLQVIVCIQNDWLLTVVCMALLHLKGFCEISLCLSSPRVNYSASWTRWRTLRDVSLCRFLGLRRLKKMSSLSRSTSSTYGTLRVRTPFPLKSPALSKITTIICSILRFHRLWNPLLLPGKNFNIK